MSTLVTLSLPQGKIIGEEVEKFERKHYKFFGIPYAKPPIGNLRFKSPQPIEQFTSDPLDCTKTRSCSIQYNNATNEITGSEDCLFLNVISRNISATAKLPVMVFIHGGAFMTGEGNRHILYPKYLLEENIVLVTINYRLGIFGFLSLPSGGISGNYGLKDQQLALKWVQENIQKFGGDSTNVTLFGHSAGGSSVHYQLLSSQSRNYFHKAICQSGLATMSWALQSKSEQKTFKLAELLGFKGNAIETANFFQNIKDPKDILINMHKILLPNEQKSILRFPFGPVIEDEKFADAFLTKHPEQILRTENIFGNIPVIIGWTSKEGILISSTTSKSLEEINSDLHCLYADTKFDTENDNERENINAKIRNFYFDGQQVSKQNINELCEVIGDTCFVVDAYKTAQLHVKYQNLSPLYCFKFSYDGKLNFYKIRYNYEHVPGACHGDEMYYLFYPNEAAEVVQPDDIDLEIAEKICKLWTNFAKCGNPTPDKCDKLNVIWNSITKKCDEDFVLNCLDIDKEISMKDSPDRKRIEFWEGLGKTKSC